MNLHTFVTRWYKKDENAVPASFILLPVSTHLPAFLDKGNQEAFSEAKGRWWQDHDVMQEALAAAAQGVLGKDNQKYSRSGQYNSTKHEITDHLGIWKLQNSRGPRIPT